MRDIETWETLYIYKYDYTSCLHAFTHDLSNCQRVMSASIPTSGLACWTTSPIFVMLLSALICYIFGWWIQFFGTTNLNKLNPSEAVRRPAIMCLDTNGWHQFVNSILRPAIISNPSANGSWLTQTGRVGTQFIPPSRPPPKPVRLTNHTGDRLARRLRLLGPPTRWRLSCLMRHLQCRNGCEKKRMKRHACRNDWWMEL